MVVRICGRHARLSDSGKCCAQAADAKKQKRKPTGKGKEDDSARASAAALASGAVVQVLPHHLAHLLCLESRCL